MMIATRYSQWNSSRPPQVAHEMVKFPLVDVQPGDEAKAEAILSREKATLMERVWAQRASLTAQAKRTGKPIEGEVQVSPSDRIWPGWVCRPRFLSNSAWQSKKASPYRFTIVNSLANYWLRYIPNRKGFAEGPYEATNTRGGPGTGEFLVESATRMLIELHGGAR